MESVKTALITGATSGIGAAFAKALAKKHFNLIITGRRENVIKAFAEQLMKDYPIKVEVVIAELSDDNDLDKLCKIIGKLNNLQLLVNNAGFTKTGKFHEEDIASYEQMIKVHALATLRLIYEALPKMINNKKGGIINVSSIMSYSPYYKQSIYTATKAFVSLLTESLVLELKNTGVHIQSLCPGLTFSDFHQRIGLDINTLGKKNFLRKNRPMTAEAVVAQSLRYLQKNKAICIPGLSNRLRVIFRTIRRLSFRN